MGTYPPLKAAAKLPPVRRDEVHALKGSNEGPTYHHNNRVVTRAPQPILNPSEPLGFGISLPSASGYNVPQPDNPYSSTSPTTIGLRPGTAIRHIYTVARPPGQSRTL
jgi:hypothetical protein